MRFGTPLLLTALLALPLPALGQDEDDLDAILGGFGGDEEEFVVDEEAIADTAERPWELSGSAEMSASFNFRHHESSSGTDYYGLQKLRNRLNLEFDVDLSSLLGVGGDWKTKFSGFGFYDAAYLLNGRREYTHNVKNRYEHEFDVTEGWIQGKLHEKLDLKLGRQIVIWGRSETIRVLDVLNPLDNREPGLVDIEDLRLSVAMAKLDAYWGAWSASFMAIPEPRFGKGPVLGSDFEVILGGAGGLGSGAALHERKPEDWEFGSWEFAGSINGIFEGWDVSLHAASFWNDNPHLTRSTRPTDLVLGPIGVRLDHARLWMIGAGGNYAIGSWILKSEFAYLDGFRFCAFDAAAGGCTGAHANRIDAMAGVEYYGISDTTISFEVANRRLVGGNTYRELPDFAQRNTEEIALRITSNFLRERLSVTALFFMFGWKHQDGSLARLSADYDIRDALVLSGGILLFQSGGALPLNSWGQNDRLFASLKYSF